MSAYKKPPRRSVTLDCSKDPSSTQQQFADECNISKAVNRWLKHGKPPERLRDNPLFLDCTGIGDYADALTTAQTAREMMLALPSETRKMLNNDPALLLDIIERNNLEELSKYGLVELHEPPAPIAEQKGASEPPAPSGAQGTGAGAPVQP